MGEILERVCDFITHGQPNHNDKLKLEVIDYIESHYQDPNLSPYEIADHLKRNKAYLCRFFRENTGAGIGPYLKKYRINQAKMLLKEGSLSVTDCAQ